MVSKKISWKKLTSRHTVKLVGKSGEKHWETGSGKLITFSGRERQEAQRFLNFKVSLRRSRKKR